MGSRFKGLEFCWLITTKQKFKIKLKKYKFIWLKLRLIVEVDLIMLINYVIMQITTIPANP